MNGAGPLKKRILIVDDSNSFTSFVERRLVRHGFEVSVVGDVASAEEAILAGSAHFFILDLFLSGVQPRFEDTDACRLVRLLESEFHPFRRAWVGFSADPEEPAYVRWRGFYPDQVMSKDDALEDLEKMVRWIEERFEAYTPHNWQIAVQYEVGADEKLKLKSGRILKREQLQQAVEELLRLSFEKGTKLGGVAVQKLRHQGYSASLKLQVSPQTPHWTPRLYVLKAGDQEEIEREYRAHRDIGFRFFPYRAGVEEPRHLRHYSLSGLLYDFVPGAEQLKEIYDAATTPETFRRFEEIMVRAFRTLGEKLFAENERSPAAQRAMAFGDERLAGDLKYLESMCTGLERTAARVQTNKLGIDCFGQLKAIFHPDPGKADIPNSCGLWVVCRCHGDLHWQNILVLKEVDQPVLIDFSESGAGAIFRDFAKFETTLALDGTPEPLAASELALFVSSQIGASIELFDVDQSRSLGDLSSPSCRALAAISSLRSCLREALGKYVLAYENGPGVEEELTRGYYFSLWREYVRAWRWMAGRNAAPRGKRLQNLLTISRIIELHCAGGAAPEGKPS